MSAATTRQRNRVAASLRRVPAPLRALLCATLLLGVAWALLVPLFQAPDEQSHFGYVQSLVEGPGLPGDAARPPFSTEQLRAQDAANSDQTAANVLVKPTWSADAWEAWQREDARLPDTARSDGGGANPASSNPPVYYLYAAVPYAVASGGDFFTRVTLMRLASIAWLLVTVVGAWLLAGEVLGRNRLLQTVAAGTVALLPMLVFVSAQIGPDTMMYALWSLVLWLGVRTIKRGATLPVVVALLGLTGLAIVVKATSYALVPATLFAVALALWRMRDDRARALRLGAAGVAALAVPVVLWFVVARVTDQAAAAQLTDASQRGGTDLRQLVSYLWQYYLPRLPFMDPFAFRSATPPAYHVFVKETWGAFGWLEVRFPDRFYTVFLFLSLAIAGAAVARIVATWRRRSAGVAIFFALVVVALLAGLHWTDYHHLTGGLGNFMQGRYLFPLMPLAGLAVAQAVAWTRGRGRAVAVALALGGLTALQFASLALVAVRFYA